MWLDAGKRRSKDLETMRLRIDWPVRRAQTAGINRAGAELVTRTPALTPCPEVSRCARLLLFCTPLSPAPRSEGAEIMVDNGADR